MALTVTHASQPAESPGAITRTQWVENHTVTGTYEAFPVGAVFLSVVSTSPATLLGYGTWSQIAQGKALFGVDTGDTDFDTAEETGGAKTKAISAHSGTAVADHAAHTHTVTSNVAVGNHAAGTTGQASAGATQRGTTASTLTLSTHTHSTPELTHSVTNNQVTSGNPNATLTHSVTQPSDHTALNVLPPYIALYVWKRTA